MEAEFQGTRIPTCYASCSVGHKPDVHNLPAKLKAISAAGFDAIELSMPDIQTYAGEIKGKEIDAKDYDTLQEVGHEIKKLCEQNKLKILMLQPFANFEGWPKGSSERQDAFDRAKGWMKIMDAVGTDMMQVGSSDAPGISSDVDVLAGDLAELADMFLPKGYKIAYENWCWATHAPDWEDVWKIVEKVNRPNIGLCLDTFQSAGGEWANPTIKGGINDHVPREELETRWKKSLQKLAATVPADKIYLLQISDAYLMDPPLKNEVDESGLRPRGQWSHDYRPLPFDGGYLPVTDFTEAVLGTKFRGWFSIEVFDEKWSEKYGEDMTPYVKQAMESVQRLLKEASEGSTLSK